MLNNGDFVLITLVEVISAPRANALSQHKSFLGHMLATYALPFVKPDEEHLAPSGNWKQSINALTLRHRNHFRTVKLFFNG